MTVAGTGESLAAFSADVEDYYQAEALRGLFPRPTWADLEDRTEANVDRLLALLAGRGVRGTFFVLGWTAERHPDLVRRIAGAGHEIGSHGYAHELVYRQTPDAFREDVRRARALLQDLSGQPVWGYRAPSYTIVRRTRWALAVLRDEGHRYDSSVFPIRRRRYGIPDAPRWPHRVEDPGAEGLVEFPLPTVRVLGVNLPATGGAYLRLLPLGFQAWAVRRLLAQGRPLVVNVHPWELDPGQPRLRVSARTRVTHYLNLERTESRLLTLLGLAAFRPQAEVLRGLGLLDAHRG
jgi:polysaccharide deacetylase family protein (PEP-CTERM system associated)